VRHPPPSRRTLVAAAALALLAAGPAWAEVVPAAADAQALAVRRADLRARVEAIQRELAAAESSRADAADALRTSAQAISEVNRRLHDLAQERRTVATALAGLEAERGALAAKVAAEQTLLARMLARQHAGSEHDPVRLILSGRDPGSISRLLHYYRVIAEARARAIARLRADMVAAQALAESARQQHLRLDALAHDESGLRVALTRERQAHAAVLDRVAAAIRRQRQELARAQRDDARLTRLVARLAELPSAPADGAGPPATGGSVPGTGLVRGGAILPVRGELTGRFGAPMPGSGRPAKGWFIRCPVGEEVRAIAAGQVVWADWLRGFGNLVIVDHGDGRMSLYGNNDALLASVGSTVRKGEAIAQAGASGASPEPGLYFEVRHQGAAVDPAPWIGH
jgi:septal ring factor EnvC (AmiA/AmiB activator)